RSNRGSTTARPASRRRPSGRRAVGRGGRSAAFPDTGRDQPWCRLGPPMGGKGSRYQKPRVMYGRADPAHSQALDQGRTFPPTQTKDSKEGRKKGNKERE